MNPIRSLERELEALKQQHHIVRAVAAWGWSYLGLGTAPWTGTDAERAALARLKVIQNELKGLRRAAGLCHKTSLVAHHV